MLALLVAAAQVACTRQDSPSPPADSGGRILIALQPLGPVASGTVQAVKEAISNRFVVEVIVLDARALPESAYYPPRKRFRAAALLTFLDRQADEKYAKIIGVTASDISIPKQEYPDWGIFGLVALGGRACVISTYRLKDEGTSSFVFRARVEKVANHEVGHTFGLPHCEHAGCLMQDAEGKISTVDSESGDFCSSCRADLNGKVGLRKRDAG